MRQQRITTSQQEVYLIYLMNNSEFAGSKIKDGECLDFVGSYEMCVVVLVYFVTLPFILRIYVVMLMFIVDDTGEYVDNWNELTTMLNNTLGPKK